MKEIHPYYRDLFLNKKSILIFIKNVYAKYLSTQEISPNYHPEREDEAVMTDYFLYKFN